MNTVDPIKNIEDLQKVKIMLSEKSKRDILLFLLGINLGLRISDILSLNVSDVKNKSVLRIREKKTGKYKSMPINPSLRQMFEDFTKFRKEEEPLFLSRFNNRMERTQCYRILHKACESAGLDYRIGTHTLRKTFGYHHYQKFKDVVLLQKIFNHSTPAITLRYIGIEQEEINLSYRNFFL